MASISRAGRSTSVNNSHKSRIANDTGFFLRLQVGILAGDILDAGTCLVGVQVMVAQNHGAGLALVELFKKSAQGSFHRGESHALSVIALKTATDGNTAC